MLFSRPLAKKCMLSMVDISAVLSLVLPWLYALMSMVAQDMWASVINACLPWR